MPRIAVEITHWLPIVTRCPVNKLPDPVFITLTFDDFVELYEVRRELRKRYSGLTIFMEDLAQAVLVDFPKARRVQVRLWFNKHTVTMER
jgi:hypothetical protein